MAQAKAHPSFSIDSFGFGADAGMAPRAHFGEYFE